VTVQRPPRDFIAAAVVFLQVNLQAVLRALFMAIAKLGVPRVQ
jgi:hypothetical protein